MRTQRLLESIDGYFSDMQAVLGAIPRDSLVSTVYHLYRAWDRRRQVFVLGNGGSASTASHVANDLSKATIVPDMPRMKVISLADNAALMTAWANDVSYEAVFEEQLKNLLEPGDVVLAISASGSSPNVVRAMEYAARHGAVTVAWTGMTGGEVKRVVDHCLQVPSTDVGMIESAHLVIDHLVTVELRQLIEARRANRVRPAAGDAKGQRPDGLAAMAAGA